MGVEGVSGALGMVGSVRDLARELGDRAISYFTGRSLDDVRSRGDQGVAAITLKFFNSVSHLSQFPNASDIENRITPATGAYEPTSETGRLVQAGGSAALAGAMLSPEGGAAALLTKAIPNVVGGVAAQGASDLGASPLVSTAAGMVAGIGTGVGVHAAAPVVSNRAALANAGDTLKSSMSNPETSVPAIVNPAPANVEGEALTPFQMTANAGTPDMGLGQTEREVSRVGGAVTAAFLDQQRATSQAQVNAAKAIQNNGSAADVGNFVTKEYRDLDQKWQDAQDLTQATAQGMAAPLGGQQPLSVYGQRILNEVSPQYQLTQEAVADQVGQLGGNVAPETIGENLRSPVLSNMETARQNRNALYQAVDPDGSMNIVTSPLRGAYSNIYDNLSPNAIQPSGREAEIRDLLQSAPDVQSFRDVMALDQNITDAMKQERKTNGESPVWGRLTLAKNAVLNTMNEAVANQVAWERAQVAAGQMRPEATIDSRIGDYLNQTRNETPQMGNYAFTPSGRQIGVDYKVVSANDVIASHNDDLSPNPNYPQSLQPRDLIASR